MARYHLSPLSENDLEGIWLYTFEHWSVAQADRYHRDIIKTIEQLASGELKGRIVDIREDYLKYSVGRHFIFFRKLDIGIEVIRILHQSMDVERYL